MMSNSVPPDVEFNTDPVAIITPERVERVRQAARASSRLRARLCLHAGPEAEFHAMLIVLLQGTRIDIHRHRNKPECYHVLSGQLTIVLHDDAGQVTGRIPLGDPASGRNSLCRICAGLWHHVEVESAEVVLFETTLGPFVPSDTEYRTAAGG